MHPGDICTVPSIRDRVVPQQDRPVGWYRDTAQPTGHRYWDGRQWRTDLEGLEGSA